MITAVFVRSEPLLRCSETDEADKKVPGGFQVAAASCLTGVIDVPPGQGPDRY